MEGHPHFLIGALWLTGLLASTPSLAGDAGESPVESAVKAAYLLNFLKFVEYPTAGERTICLLGADPVGPVLEELIKAHSTSQNPVRLRYIRSGADAKSCQILFLALDSPRIHAALSQVETAPVLTVSEAPGFLELGGMILLFHDAGRLQFEISAERTRKVGLRVSSKLLVLSRSAR